VKRRKGSIRLLRIADEDFTAIVTYVLPTTPKLRKSSRRESRRI